MFQLYHIQHDLEEKLYFTTLPPNHSKTVRERREREAMTGRQAGIPGTRVGEVTEWGALPGESKG